MSFFTAHIAPFIDIAFFIFLGLTNLFNLMLRLFTPHGKLFGLAAAPPHRPTPLTPMGGTRPIEVILLRVVLGAVSAGAGVGVESSKTLLFQTIQFLLE